MYKLNNPNPSKEAVELFDFLQENYGKKVISGQHTKTTALIDVWKVMSITGKIPAICGFELLGYSPNVNYTDTDDDAITEVMENMNTIDSALSWAKVHKGIVTYTWHWFSPMRGHNKAFYTQYTDFNAAKAVTRGTPEYNATIRDIDMIANLLKRFKDLNVPILWRPLHEADGKWFWWGAKGADACVKLWKLIYHRFNNIHNLNNLIWVWNSVNPEWYPGDDCVDIISRDLYAKDNGSRKDEFLEVKKLNPEKIVSLAECGMVPDPDKMMEDGAMWSWFMEWCGMQGASDETLKAIYNNPLTITLDDLPWRK